MDAPHSIVSSKGNLPGCCCVFALIDHHIKVFQQRVYKQLHITFPLQLVRQSGRLWGWIIALFQNAAKESFHFSLFSVTNKLFSVAFYGFDKYSSRQGLRPAAVQSVSEVCSEGYWWAVGLRKLKSHSNQASSWLLFAGLTLRYISPYFSSPLSFSLFFFFNRAWLSSAITLTARCFTYWWDTLWCFLSRARGTQSLIQHRGVQ